MYYLQSRYYDPQIARFINADEPDMFRWGGSVVPDAFVYCSNSPVVYVDYAGYSKVAVKERISSAPIIAFPTSGFKTAVPVGSVATVFAWLRASALLSGLKEKRLTKKAATAIEKATPQLAGYLNTAISEALAKAKRAKRSFGNDLHHIVAKRDPRADFSRELLEDNGLSCHEAYNLVLINRTLHQYLHTSAYHYGVYLVLAFAAAKTTKRSEKKHYILAALALIRMLLLAASNSV